MNFYKRLLSVLCTLVVLVMLIYTSWGQSANSLIGDAATGEETPVLTIWYTDDALSQFLLDSIQEYSKKTGIQAVAKLVSAVDYIETINSESVSEEGQGPDIYIMANNMVEKAYMAGLILPNEDSTYTENNYASTSLHALTYQNQLMGYPLYFENSFLLYNKGVTETIPANITDIMTFAEAFEGAEGVENIFKWNVADIFYDYFFVGNYADLGGENGDDREKVNLDNQEVRDALAVYQSLNAYFAIDMETVTTDSVMTEFAEGKTIYTIAKTDNIIDLEKKIAEGTSTVNYGIAALPNVNQTLASKGMSITTGVFVNGYTKYEKASKNLARFLTNDMASDLYSSAGKFSAKRDIEYQNPEHANIFAQYENSVPIPKLMAVSNYWVEMEIAFTNIWKGSDIGEQIQSVSGKMQSQLAQ